MSAYAVAILLFTESCACAAEQGSLERNVDAFSPVEAKGLANLILDWSDAGGILVTPMKLQKLMYYCHADFMVSPGVPLIAQEFEAWDYGPVIPSVFGAFKKFGGEPIDDRAAQFNPITATLEVAPRADLGGALGLVRQSFDIYANFSAGMLSRMSHVEQGPWDEARKMFARGLNANRRISNSLIRAYHRPRGQDSLH
jgi:uncharacterized phage-associated protein